MADGLIPVWLNPERMDLLTPSIDAGTWREAQTLRRQRPDVLGNPRALARYLCGVSTPRLSRARLGSPLNGALADVPFQEVLRRAEAEK